MTVGHDGPKKYHSGDFHSVRIGNDLPKDITDDEIRDVFSKFGEIGDVFMPKDLIVIRYQKKSRIRVRLVCQEGRSRLCIVFKKYSG